MIIFATSTHQQLYLGATEPSSISTAAISVLTYAWPVLVPSVLTIWFANRFPHHFFPTFTAHVKFLLYLALCQWEIFCIIVLLTYEVYDIIAFYITVILFSLMFFLVIRDLLVRIFQLFSCIASLAVYCSSQIDAFFTIFTAIYVQGFSSLWLSIVSRFFVVLYYDRAPELSGQQLSICASSVLDSSHALLLSPVGLTHYLTSCANSIAAQFDAFITSFIAVYMEKFMSLWLFIVSRMLMMMYDSRTCAHSYKQLFICASSDSKSSYAVSPFPNDSSSFLLQPVNRCVLSGGGRGARAASRSSSTASLRIVTAFRGIFRRHPICWLLVTLQVLGRIVWPESFFEYARTHSDMFSCLFEMIRKVQRQRSAPISDRDSTKFAVTFINYINNQLHPTSTWHIARHQDASESLSYALNMICDLSFSAQVSSQLNLSSTSMTHALPLSIFPRPPQQADLECLGQIQYFALSMFSITTCSRVYCGGLSQIRDCLKDYMVRLHLPVDHGQTVSLQSLFSDYLAPEYVEIAQCSMCGHSHMHDSSCSDSHCSEQCGAMRKQVGFEVLPPVLFVQLQRNLSGSLKNNVQINCSSPVSLSCGGRNYRYRALMIVNHHGTFAVSGDNHYTFDYKTDSSIVNVDDHIVDIKSTTFHAAACYVIILKRSSARAAAVDTGATSALSTSVPRATTKVLGSKKRRRHASSQLSSLIPPNKRQRCSTGQYYKRHQKLHNQTIPEQGVQQSDFNATRGKKRVFSCVSRDLSASEDCETATVKKRKLNAFQSSGAVDAVKLLSVGLESIQFDALSEDGGGEDQASQFPCEHCNKCFDNRNSLVRHNTSHIRKKNKRRAAKAASKRKNYDSAKRKAAYDSEKRRANHQATYDPIKRAESYRAENDSDSAELRNICDLAAPMDESALTSALFLSTDKVKKWQALVKELPPVTLYDDIQKQFDELVKEVGVDDDLMKDRWTTLHFRNRPVHKLLGVPRPEPEIHEEPMYEMSSDDNLDPEQFDPRRPSKIPKTKRKYVGVRGWYHPLGDVNSIDADQFPYDDFGGRSVICPWCRAKKWPDETFAMCCREGKVVINDPPMPPKEMEGFFRSRMFLEHASSWNKVFSLTSCSISRILPKGKGPPCFTIFGRTKHYIGPMKSDTPKNVGWIQLYLIDPEVALQKRVDIWKEYFGSPKVQIKLREVEQWLQKHNQFIKSFHYARDIHQSIQPARNVSIMFVDDQNPKKAHPRVWNLPTEKGMCGLLIDVDELSSDEQYRHVIVRPKGGTTQQVWETHADFMPMHYILLFPYGTPQWDLHKLMQNGRRLTSRMWNRLLLMEREGVSNHIFKCSTLFQQFLIETYTQVLLQELRYLKMHQPKIRAACYQDIKDNSEADNGEKPGKRIVLPSSVPGSPRYMKMLFRDFLAICRKFGEPDLFITFTCNPKWPEITNELGTGWARSCPWARPDIVNRVFRKKLKRFRHKLKNRGYMGLVVADVRVMEFQKRGLPHAHILVWLAAADKPKTPADVDRLVSAEVPDPVKQPRLHKLVKNHLIHTPCDKNHPAYDPLAYKPCLVDGVCGRRFPYPLQDETTLPQDSFAQPKRTDPKQGGHVFKWTKLKKHKEDPDEICDIDASWVVKYNGPMVLEFDAHINVEVCATLQTCKYVCKYFTKGYDMSSLKLAEEQQLDEIECHQNARYLGAFEAHWHLFFTRALKNPAVKRLNVHLENQESIMFNEEQELEVDKLDRLKRTTLNGFFELNRLEPQSQYTPPSRMIPYQDIPEFYRWMSKDRLWQRRKNCQQLDPVVWRNPQQIGRIHSISMHNMELWCLRKLLLRTTGATSFRSLRTVPKSDDINLVVDRHEAHLARRSGRTEMELDDSIDVDMERRDVSSDVDVESCGDSETAVGSLRQRLSEIHLRSRPSTPTRSPSPSVLHSFFELDEDELKPDNNSDELCHIDTELPPDAVTVYPTFRLACDARGYLDSDEEWSLALIEAYDSGASGTQLREMFCFILMNNTPANSGELWEKHQIIMSDDKIHQAKSQSYSESVGINRALLEIQDMLLTHGFLMSQFQLPEPVPEEKVWELAADLRAELSYNIEECQALYEDAVNKMKNNEEQKDLFAAIKREIDNPVRTRNNVHFVDAPGGTGKTFVFNALLNYVRSRPPVAGQKHIALALAASGIAALLLAGGRTVHSRFGLGIDVNAATSCAYGSRECVLSQLLRRTDIILWDECTMSSKFVVDAVDRALRDILNEPELPFGGKLIVFGGDFRQTLCVVENANRAMTVNQCILNSATWDSAKKHKLTTNMRILLSRDRHNIELMQWWSDWLLAIGEGSNLVRDADVLERVPCKDLVRIPTEVIAESKTPEQLINEIYPNLGDNTCVEDIRTTAILTPTNRSVDMLNEMALDRVKGEDIIRMSEDSVENDGDGEQLKQYSEEFLNGKSPSGMPKSRLRLKIGVPIVLLRNLAPIKGCCNGTRLVVDKVNKFSIVARIINGPKKFFNRTYYIPRITLISKPGYYSGFQLRRKQFPTRIAYNMTINKAQGQTFKKIGLYLPQPVFAHGQLYVAMSRVGTPSDVKLLLQPTKHQMKLDGHWYTRNIVYKEVLTKTT